mgnify:CR=1 FL=1
MKIVTNKIKNTDEYSITRYSIYGIILKTIIFIILYIIYTYLGMYNFEEALSNKMRIKFVIGSLPFFIFLYSEAILGSSKEILLIKEDYLILKKYILFFCYYSKVIKLEDIRKILEKNERYIENLDKTQESFKNYYENVFQEDIYKVIYFKYYESFKENKVTQNNIIDGIKEIFSKGNFKLNDGSHLIQMYRIELNEKLKK